MQTLDLVHKVFDHWCYPAVHPGPREIVLAACEDEGAVAEAVCRRCVDAALGGCMVVAPVIPSDRCRQIEYVAAGCVASDPSLSRIIDQIVAINLVEAGLDDFDSNLIV